MASLANSVIAFPEQVAALDAHLARAGAGGALARFRALLCTAAATGVAADLRGNVNRHVVAADRLLEIEFQLVAEISTSKDLATAAATSATKVEAKSFEDVRELFEDIADILEPAATATGL